ncbi:PTS sugar transporter subunit IIB [Sporolactobacillus sp. THM19-2]|uniref:PTS sugar transporter subunit IIB n=1 Tax=Sporolactobacillus sp. THM19-2 TaxID=2511171 RepID=UPI00101FECC1|nr:PTS sugar transporter subunit IIB [Sporolactobacillus sp. THM19-2]RYL87808.1 PTS galactitol transporter subunit IIB [Sporolactobacillus sp. THM19-2]
MAKKRVLVACGAGIATSTVLVDRVEKLFKKNHIDAEIVQCKITEVKSKQRDADLIVSSTILPTKYEIPAVVATAYISGINMEAMDEKILGYLK